MHDGIEAVKGSCLLDRSETGLVLTAGRSSVARAARDLGLKDGAIVEREYLNCCGYEYASRLGCE